MKGLFAAFVVLSVIPVACSSGSTKLGEGGDAVSGAGAGGDDSGVVTESCDNKPCGAQCGDGVEKYCDAGGNCTLNYPTCEAPQCESTDDCPQPGAPCEQCPDGTSACPSVICVLGECVGTFPTCQGETCQADSDCPQ